MTDKAKAWLAKAYPVPANEVPKRKIACIEHGLAKWEMLRRAELDEYELFCIDDAVWDGEHRILKIDDTSCALCHHWHDRTSLTYTPCRLCPIDHKECGVGGAWRAWTSHRNPEPMILVLREALTREKAKAAKRKRN